VATHQPVRMIALIVEYTITSAVERFNFKILAALASPFVVAIIIIVIEIIACYRWRRMTARLPKRPPQEPQPRTGSISSSIIVAEPLSRTIAELPAQSAIRLAVSRETSPIRTRSHYIWTAGTREGGVLSRHAKAGPRLWLSWICKLGRRKSNTDNVESFYDI
jgi:hypothetical protein